MKKEIINKAKKVSIILIILSFLNLLFPFIAMFIFGFVFSYGKIINNLFPFCIEDKTLLGISTLPCYHFIDIYIFITFIVIFCISLMIYLIFYILGRRNKNIYFLIYKVMEEVKNEELKETQNLEKEKQDKIKFKKRIITYVVLVFVVAFGILIIRASYQKTENNHMSSPGMKAKPVIYLYPEKTEEVKVELDYKGKIIADFPRYDDKIKGWEVTAFKDGKIINHSDNKEYSYLFWEGKPKQKINRDLSKGFVVSGEDSREFLQEKLKELGLTPKEYNEFIVYWYPLMQKNKYNLVHFADKQYTDVAPLKITPKPDSILRVFMVYKPLKEKINIAKQEIKPFKRQGFTVIEWGGTILEE